MRTRSPEKIERRSPPRKNDALLFPLLHYEVRAQENRLADAFAVIRPVSFCR